MPADIVQTQYSRMFVLENRAGPTSAPLYQGFWKAGAFTWAQGDVTLVRVQSADQYGQFDTIDKLSGDRGAPTLTITSRYEFQISDLLRLVRRGCDSDYQVHFGKCRNPRDFDRGWEKILVIESARPTNYSTGDLGAADPSERAVVVEEVPVAGEDAFEIKPITYAQKATTLISREIVGVSVCDSPTCGVCGLSSDGCSIAFAVGLGSGAASPGLAPELYATNNGGGVWWELPITTMLATEQPIDLTCVGTNVVVVSQTGGSLHVTPIIEAADAADNITSWSKVTTGFVAGGAPRSIASASPTFTWIVGTGGYIYFSSDPSSFVTVQEAGNVTTQQYNDVFALDNEIVLAVGNANVVAFTDNGGASWHGITGPAPGVNLTVAALQSARVWWVGTAAGTLYYTTDAGAHWFPKGFPGSGAGTVRDIAFSNGTVGWLAHSMVVGANERGRILRTVNGGYSWYVSPEDVGQTIPTNTYIGKLGACVDPNKIFGGGLGATPTSGMLVLGS